MARAVVFIEETDYLLDNSRPTKDTSSFENGTVLILNEESICLSVKVLKMKVLFNPSLV